MKLLISAAISLVFLNSCLFEEPFEATAKQAVVPGLLGSWEEVAASPDEEINRMLVLQYSPNEYVVEYPTGAKGMFFRAFGIELEGQPYVQVQLVGAADGPVKPADRKYHLVKVQQDGDTLEMRVLESEVLGKPAGTAQLRAAFAAHQKDANLFGKPAKFRRVK